MARREPLPTAAPLVPPTPTLGALSAAARGCRACDLYARATQTVFGEGAAGARVMLVGEQPSDREDRSGRPFVGPAGKLLDEALERAGIERGEAYVTNVVKHFKFEAQGKRRIHAKPNAREIAACRPWLDAELVAVRPRLLVCLGATAAMALLGRGFRVSTQRGMRVDTALAPAAMATVHPSSVLRAPDPERRRLERERFFADLQAAARLLRGEA